MVDLMDITSHSKLLFNTNLDLKSIHELQTFPLNQHILLLQKDQKILFHQLEEDLLRQINKLVTHNLFYQKDIVQKVFEYQDSNSIIKYLHKEILEINHHLLNQDFYLL